MINVNEQMSEKKFQVGKYYSVSKKKDNDPSIVKVVGRTAQTLKIEWKRIGKIDGKWGVVTKQAKVYVTVDENGYEKMRKCKYWTAYHVVECLDPNAEADREYDRQFAEVILEIAGDKFDREGVDEASYKWAKQVMGVENETESNENDDEYEFADVLAALKEFDTEE